MEDTGITEVTPQIPCCQSTMRRSIHSSCRSRIAVAPILLMAAASLLWPPTATAQNPGIVFTSVPDHGSNDWVSGRVQGVNPAQCSVALYIFVDGNNWWTKPYFNPPLVKIDSDSTWSCPYATGGDDRFAIRLKACIWPNGLNPFIADNAETLPSWLDTLPHTDTIRTTRRVVRFSGAEWCVKTGDSKHGPGPNYFSDDTGNVWVDSLGRLHLRIVQRSGNWYCAEVYRTDPVGYGPYVFSVAGPIGNLDSNVVLGLFTYDNWPLPPYHRNLHREIDIEFSRWGSSDDPNAQFVVQPWDIPGNRHRWRLPPSLDSLTSSFNWQHDSIRFLTVRGYQYAPPCDSVLQDSLYTGPDIPDTSWSAIPRMNLWLYEGNSPGSDSSIEVVIARFDTGNAITEMTQPQGPVPYLSACCPSPARHFARVRFTVPRSCHVSLAVFDMQGRETERLIDGRLSAGKHEVRWRTQGLPDGVYHCRGNIDGRIFTARLLVLAD
jgi:hypothetical protein